MLSGVRVLDLSGEPGWLAGRILADLGADVVKVEPPGGDRIARRRPYLREVPDPEQSLSWAVFQAGKRGITLDGTALAARWARAQLLSWADVLIESFRSSVRTAWGLDADRTGAEHPRLVHCSITPFGRTGPYAEFRGGDLVVVAMGGGTVPTGDAERPPVRCSVPESVLRAGPEAALGIVMALHARAATGRGGLVDVSLQECVANGLRTSGSSREIWAARDGWVLYRLDPEAKRDCGLRALLAWLAESGSMPEGPLSVDADLEPALASFFGARGRAELVEGAVDRGIPLAPCNDADAITAHPQFRARELFTTLELPACDAAIELPGSFARSTGYPIGVRRRAPRIGEHQHEVFAEAGIGRAECEKLAAEGAI
jgi:crotonobetainyl-CoA:carnitine CoA-transferase CaiB-like acyl-CoA transferase